MLRSYQAVYRGGRLRWSAPRPRLAEGTRVIVVVEEDLAAAEREAARRVLDTAWGAWGSNRSPDELDRDLDALRSEWEGSASVHES